MLRLLLQATKYLCWRIFRISLYEELPIATQNIIVTTPKTSLIYFNLKFTNQTTSSRRASLGGSEFHRGGEGNGSSQRDFAAQLQGCFGKSSRIYYFGNIYLDNGQHTVWRKSTVYLLIIQIFLTENFRHVFWVAPGHNPLTCYPAQSLLLPHVMC